jgi:hypothetical protein
MWQTIMQDLALPYERLTQNKCMISGQLHMSFSQRKELLQRCEKYDVFVASFNFVVLFQLACFFLIPFLSAYNLTPAFLVFTCLLVWFLIDCLFDSCDIYIGTHRRDYGIECVDFYAFSPIDSTKQTLLCPSCGLFRVALQPHIDFTMRKRDAKVVVRASTGVNYKGKKCYYWLLARGATPTEELRGRFVRELSGLLSFSHPNLLGFEGFVLKPRELAILTPYLPQWIVLKKVISLLSPFQKCALAISACEGLDFLHQHDQVHRDIRCSTLLIRLSSILNAKKVTKLDVKWFGFGLGRNNCICFPKSH